MKILLLDSVRLNIFLHMKYLEAKGIPFWLYTYDEEMDRMEKLENRENQIDTLYTSAEYAIYKKDFGQFKEYNPCGPDEFEHVYYFDMMDDIRTDKDLIDAYEKYENDVYESCRVDDVPEGEEFSVIAITDKEGNIFEKLILKSEAKWMKAE